MPASTLLPDLPLADAAAIDAGVELVLARAAAVTFARPARLYRLPETKDARAVGLEAVKQAIEHAPEIQVIDPVGQGLLEELSQMSHKVQNTAHSGDPATLASQAAAELEEFLAFAADRLGLSRSGGAFACYATELKPLEWRDVRSVARETIRARHGEHLTIELPGAGAYRVPLEKDRLTEFANRLTTRFGKWNAGAFSVPSTARSSRTSPPPLTKKLRDEHLREVLALTVSDEPTRRILAHVLSDSGFSVSTDGRRLTVLRGSLGLTAEEITLKSGSKFPAWRQVLPKWIDLADGRFTCSLPVTATIDSAELFQAVRQAECATSERQSTASLHVVAGILQISAVAQMDENDGQVAFAMEGIPENAEPAVSFHLAFIDTVARQARKLGIATVQVIIEAADKPAVVLFGDLGFSVIMPVRLN